MKNTKAFTLIELLVVVLIIGILAAVALPQYQYAVEKSRLAKALMSISNMERAIEIYAQENGLPESEVTFVGPDATANSVIEFQSFICDVEQAWAGTMCRDGDFAYSATCNEAECGIMALRCPNGQCDEEGSNADYMLLETYVPGVSSFADGGICMGNSTLGNKICANMGGKWENLAG